MCAQRDVPDVPIRARAGPGPWDAVVVGSGVGGVVAASRMAHAGLRVLVLERSDRVGGILASFRRQGFKIDVGSHLVARGDRGALGAALRAVGLDRPRFLRHPIPVRSRGLFEATAPSRRRGLPATALRVVRELGVPTRDRRRLARMAFDVLTLTEPELRRWDRHTLHTFVTGYTEHPGAYYLLAFLASIFFVLPPWEVSAGEALRALRALLVDYRLSYVEGGMDRVPHALLGRVVQADGEVVVGHEVTAIRRAGDRLRVVTADGAEHEAPRVACDVAPQELPRLLEGADAPATWLETLRAIRPSGNAHQVKLALRRPLVDEGCIIGGLSPSGLTLDDLDLPLMERTVAAIAEGRVADPLALYAPVPTNFDPSVAPPGHQLIVASIYGPATADPLDPPERWEAHIHAALRTILPGLDDALLFHEMTPVPAIGRWMGRSSLGAISNGQRPGQVGRDRLPVTTPVPGLALCGDGAGGRGIGMELAADSGRQAADVLLGAGRGR